MTDFVSQIIGDGATPRAGPTPRTARATPRTCGILFYIIRDGATPRAGPTPREARLYNWASPDRPVYPELKPAHV